MNSLARMLLETYYFLRKDYGTVIQYTKPGKGDIDSETGTRDTSADKTFGIAAVLTPIGVTTEFILKLLGKHERRQVVFLVKASDLKNIQVEAGDWFIHANLKYRNLEFEDFGGVLYGLTGDTFS